jgi:hypothetical protein
MKIDLYLKFIKLEPSIIKPLEKLFESDDGSSSSSSPSSNYIDIESWLLCMKKYKEMLGNELKSVENKLNELSIILQFINTIE